MSEALQLLAILAALYLLECVLWVPSGHLCAYRRLPGRVAFVAPEELLGSHRGGLLLQSPLPGLGRAFLCRTPADTGLLPVLDLTAVRAREAFSKQLLTPVVVAESLLFAVIFVVGPLTVATFGWAHTWLPLASVAALADAAAVLTFRRAHRKLFPGQAPERRRQTLLLAISPLAAMRAAEELGKGVLAGFDPLAVALVLGRREAALAVVRRRLYDLGCRHGQALPPARRDGTDALPWRALLSALREAGFEPATLCAPPAPDSPGSLAYCPRCHAQFSVTDASCDACSGVAVVPLPVRVA
jgi:hypothetical protein